MHRELLKQIGIAAATLGCILLSVLVVWIFYGHTILPPEQWLPADTVALVSNANGSGQLLLRQTFPVLSSLPALKSTTTAALIRLPSGQLAWVTFTPQLTLSADPYNIQSSSPEALKLIGKQKTSLENNPTYRLLLAQRKPEGTWAFLNGPTLKGNEQMSPWSWLTLHAATAIMADSESITLSSPSEGLPHLPTFHQQLPSAFLHPLAIIQATDSLATFPAWSSSLDPMLPMTIKGLLGEWLWQTFGSDISPTYDLAPLLKEQSTVHVALDPKNGHALVLLEGSSPADAMHDLSARLFTSFKAHLPLGKQEIRTFDEKKFSSDTMVEDTSLLTEKTSTVEGWDLHTLQSASGSFLGIAVHASSFLIANNEEALMHRIRQDLPPIPLADRSGELLAAGMIDTDQANSLLSHTLPTFWNGSLPSMLQGNLLWTVTRDRGMVTVEIKR